MRIKNFVAFFTVIFLFLSCTQQNSSVYKDITFYSKAFKTDRNYRIYLPNDYRKNSEKRYPVIYYFHGYGGRYKWDAYNVEDDINRHENGRKEPPFVMEWKNYVKTHDVIIVTWDGYEPNQFPGLKEREGIKYESCKPYDFIRAHDMGTEKFWGWDYRLYFRDLVANVDSLFRTIPDRDHRAVTGLSMGGLTSLYIGGQCKDLIGSVSTFDPADNLPYYGPKGKQVVFPVLEMYRSLKGLPVRLTMTDGDWLKYNDWEMKRIFEASGIDFRFHLADYPDHWAGDASLQLDYHMREFGKKHQTPVNWGHINTAYPEFKAWEYNFKIEREEPALTVVENVSKRSMKIMGRTFIPGGPIIQNENIRVETDGIYSPLSQYRLITYNLSNGIFQNKNTKSTDEGKLHIELGGGGHIIGINKAGEQAEPNLRIVQKDNRDYWYFEEKKPVSIGFSVVNVGDGDAKNIRIRAFSNHQYLSFSDSVINIPALKSASSVQLENCFNFTVSQYSDSSFAGAILMEVSVNGVVADTHRVMFFTTAKSEKVTNLNDVIILDGRTVKNVPYYKQGANVVGTSNFAGGKGNGNGKPGRGEELLILVKLEKGMAPNDSATFHRTFLLNNFDDPYLKVNRLNYEERMHQASKTHVSSVITIDKNTPPGHVFNLWLKVETLYNDKNDPVSRATIYAHRYYYRKLKLKLAE